MDAPSIVSLKDNVITWGNVPNAEGYLILKKQGLNGSWEEICQVNGNKGVIQSKMLDTVDNNSYYGVKAYANKNGVKVYSLYEKNFTLKDCLEENLKYKLLYIGDSITYGSPYMKTLKTPIFSMPYRVSQLLGCVYYNPSSPASTYHYINNPKNIRPCIAKDIIDPISLGKLPGNGKSPCNSKNSEGITHSSLDDYNIVVLTAGTNDYIANAKLGSLNSYELSTFNGALNYILGKIEYTSKQRVERNESPIKVVFVDLFYSDRSYDFTKRCNRDVTPNKIGLTLMDYQNALHNQLNKWEKSSKYLSFYNFNTRDYDIVNEKNCPYTTSDNLHFTKFIYAQYGNAFANFLLENVFD